MISGVDCVVTPVEKIMLVMTQKNLLESLYGTHVILSVNIAKVIYTWATASVRT